MPPRGGNFTVLAWTPPEAPECGPPGARICEGHDEPAIGALPWDGPSDFFDGPDDPERRRCQQRHVTDYAVKVAQLYFAWSERRTPPCAGQRLAWPAPLCEALAVYGHHASRRDARDLEERTKAASRPSPRPGRAARPISED